MTRFAGCAILSVLPVLACLADESCGWCDVEYLKPVSSGAQSSSLPFVWSRGEAETNRIDLLLVFDASARSWLTGNGWSSSEAFAHEAVLEMNAGLANTELDRLFTFRLAGVCDLVPDLSAESLSDVRQYAAGTRKPSEDLQSEFARVRARRDSDRADIVVVLTDGDVKSVYGSSFGMELQNFKTSAIAKFAERAYSACAISSVFTRYTLLHEVGHVMGAGHVRELHVYLGQGPQLFDYSAGYNFVVDGTHYTTVMGYPVDGLNWDFEWERLPFFSSPDFTLMKEDPGTGLWVDSGVRVGVRGENDNTRTLRETYAVVSNFRVARQLQERPDEPEPGPEPEPVRVSLPLRFAANVRLVPLDLEGVKSVTVSKKGSLPSGLSIKCDKATGAIVLTGRPTKAKETTVTCTCTLTYADGRRVTSEPAEVTVSTYDPTEMNPCLGEKLARTVPLVSGGRLVGLLSVTATTSGRVTAKFTGSETVSFSGYWTSLREDATAGAALAKKDASLALSLDADGRLDARLANVGGFAVLDGFSEALADAASFAGRYSVALVNGSADGVNFGHGSLQLTMTTASRIKSGTVSYSGVLPDGTSLSGTSQLCADGKLDYEDGTSYACAVLPIYKKTSKTEVALLLRVRAGGAETYGDESMTLSHVVGSSDRGGCMWNGLILQPSGSWFKTNVALSGWQDIYEHVPSVFDLKLGGVKVATVTASGSKVKLTDKPQGSTVSMSYTKSSGRLSGSIRLKLEDGSKLSGSWKGALLPGWHYSCGGCGDDDGVVLPFGMGTFYYTDRSTGKSVKASLPVTLEILAD